MGPLKRNRVGELARRMSALLLAELPLDVVFERLCNLLADFVEAPVVFIALRNPDGSLLEFRHAGGRVTRVISRELQEQDLIDRAFAQGAFVSTLPAAIFAPLQVGDETIGVLAIERGAGCYTHADLTLLESIAPYVAVAIRNRTLQDAVAHEKYRADHDPLTGLANRNLFADRLSHAVRRADRSGELVGVVYADLDRFKRVNDTLGHAAGDAVLAQLAKRFAQSARASDTIARIGGDEFAMIVEGLHHPGEIGTIAEKLERCLREPVVVAGRAVDVGISVGSSVYPVDTSDLARLLELADTSMYASKERHHSAARP